MLLVSALVYEILFEALGKEPKYTLSHLFSKLLRVGKMKTRHLAIILSVSWDALLFGPVVIAQVKSGDWTNDMIILAFCLFGIIV